MDRNLREFHHLLPKTRFLEMQFTVNRKMISNAWISNLYTSHQIVIQPRHRSSYDEVKCMALIMARTLNMLLKTKAIQHVNKPLCMPVVQIINVEIEISCNQ